MGLVAEITQLFNDCQLAQKPLAFPAGFCAELWLFTF